MPIYEYTCLNCKKIFERIRPFAQATFEADCPTCGRAAGRKISIPSPAIVPGGTNAQKNGGLMTLGDFPDTNSWIDS